MNLALFLANFLTYHLRAVETPKSKDVLLNAHLYLVKVSQVEDREVFKICLEYWIKLVSELYDEIQSLPIGESGLLMGLSLGGGPASSVLNGVPLRKNIYTDVLSNLRLVVIERMVKPEEVALSLLVFCSQVDGGFLGPHCRERRRGDRSRVHERERHHRSLQINARTPRVPHPS
jgi:exportin-1